MERAWSVSGEIISKEIIIENKTTEPKREYTDDIKYTVIAFVNTDNGRFILE